MCYLCYVLDYLRKQKLLMLKFSIICYLLCFFFNFLATLKWVAKYCLSGTHDPILKCSNLLTMFDFFPSPNWVIFLLLKLSEVSKIGIWKITKNLFFYLVKRVVLKPVNFWNMLLSISCMGRSTVKSIVTFNLPSVIFVWVLLTLIF